MKEINRILIKPYIDSLTKASGLRTFPNKKSMNLVESVAINNIGKILEIVGVILNDIVNGKRRMKAIRKLRECRRKLEDLYVKEYQKWKTKGEWDYEKNN